MLTPVNSELLCFICDKTKIMALDDIVKVCADFFNEDEIFSARQLLEDHGCKMHKRKGVDKLRATVQDMAMTILDPKTQLPQFYALNLNRLPPVSTSHCDVSAILAELQALRMEVRSISELREEVSVLKAEILSIRKSREVVAGSSYLQEFPSLTNMNSVDSDDGAQTQHHVAIAKSFVGLAKQIKGDANAFKDTTTMKKKAANKLIVGKSVGNKHLKSVQTVRTVDIFVSRLHPATVDEDLVQCVATMKDKVDVLELNCCKLKSKYENLYASYHVAIKVDSAVFKQAIELFMSEEVWPCGMFVKRYFRKRDGGSD